MPNMYTDGASCMTCSFLRTCAALCSTEFRNAKGVDKSMWQTMGKKSGQSLIKDSVSTHEEAIEGQSPEKAAAMDDN